MPWEEAVNTGRQGRTINFIDPLNEPTPERRVLDEESFRRVIAIERKRTERSKAPFVLMLLEVTNQSPEKAASALESVMSVLLATSRDTDLVGWYKSKTTIGALFTGLVAGDKSSILMTILSRATNTLRDELSFEQLISLIFLCTTIPTTGKRTGRAARAIPHSIRTFPPKPMERSPCSF